MTKEADPFWHRLTPIGGALFFSAIASPLVSIPLTLLLRESLHLSYIQIGAIEGLAVGVAFFSKIATGLLLDHTRARRKILCAGTAASALAKLLLACSVNVAMVLCARLAERMAKGPRSCPVDVLIAEIAQPAQRGRLYRIKYALITAGSMLGCYAASVCLLVCAARYQLIFALGAIPAALAFWCAKQYRPTVEESAPASPEPFWSRLHALPAVYWRFLGAVALLLLAQFSEAFVVLRARCIGASAPYLPSLSATYSLCAAASAAICALWRLRNKELQLLRCAIVCLGTAHALFWIAPSAAWLFAGCAISGLHAGIYHGAVITLLTAYSRSHNRGTALSFYYIAAGVSCAFGNFLAGCLNSISILRAGAFVGGVVFCALSWWSLRSLPAPAPSEESS